MRAISIPAFALGACLCFGQALADNNCGDGFTTVNFNRTDLANIKKTVTAMAAALGNAPAPYAKENDQWELPTYACKGKAGFRPITTRYSFRLSTEVEQKKFAAQYQKEIMAAQASGDPEKIMQVSQEYQKKMMQMAAANQNNSPVDIAINVNEGGSGTIDPDAVLRDGAGFIALRESSDAGSGSEIVNLYFDKVALRDAHEAASFDTGGDVTVPGRFDAINVHMNIGGPKTIVDALVKQLKTAGVLGQLSEKRTKIDD